MDILKEGVKVAIIGICILIVAIPEGLPVAVSIAMALSSSKLKADNILIKNMEAVQTAAMIHDICIGKTGTVTYGDKMKVRMIQLFNQQHIFDSTTGDGETPYFDKQVDSISDGHKKLIYDLILNNTDVRLEVNDETCTY